jgi:hypothetical protein
MVQRTTLRLAAGCDGSRKQLESLRTMVKRLQAGPARRPCPDTAKGPGGGEEADTGRRSPSEGFKPD